MRCENVRNKLEIDTRKCAGLAWLVFASAECDGAGKLSCADGKTGDKCPGDRVVHAPGASSCEQKPFCMDLACPNRLGVLCKG